MISLRKTFLISYPFDNIFKQWAENIIIKYDKKLQKSIVHKLCFKITEFDFPILRCLT
jgi:hypothetical protein